MKQQRLPIYYVGQKTFFNLLEQIKIETTLLIPQPCVLSIQPQFVPLSDKGFLEPILTIILIGEQTRQLISKNGLKSFTQNTIYIYYPYELRVDQSIYKVRINNYEAMLKQIPRNQRDYFTRLLLWEEGRGQHQIQNQVQKIFTLIGRELKTSIQKRVANLIEQQKKVENQPVSYNRITRIHILKTKICKVYDFLKLYHWITPILQQQYKNIWLSMQFFQMVQLYRNRSTIINPQQCKTEDIFKIIQQSRIYFLELVTHSFYELFIHFVKIVKLLEALQFLKDFINTIETHIFKIATECSQTPKIQHLFQNIWLVQLMEDSLSLIASAKNLLISSKKSQFDVQYFGLKMIVKSKLEQMGSIIYNFDPSIFNFSTISHEIQIFFEYLNSRSSQEKQKTQEQLTLNDASLLEYLRLLKIQSLRDAFTMNYSKFLSFYVHYLQDLYFSLKDSRLKRIEFSLRLVLLKAKILYPKIVSENVSTLLQEEIKNINEYQDLQLLYDLYMALVCKYYQKSQQFIENICSLFRNKSLNNSNRHKLLEYLENSNKNLNLYCYPAITSTFRLENTEKKYCFKFTIIIQQYFDLTNCFQDIIITIKNIKKQDSKIKIIATPKYIQNNVWQGTTEFISEEYMVFQISNVQIRWKSIIFPLVVSQQIKKINYYINEIKIREKWSLTQNVIYKKLLTPIQVELMQSRPFQNLMIKIKVSQVSLIKVLYKSKQIQFKQQNDTIIIQFIPQVQAISIILQFWFVVKQDEFQSLAFNFINYIFYTENNSINYRLKFKVKQSLEFVYFSGDRLSFYKIKNICQNQVYIQGKKQVVVLKKNQLISVRQEKIKAGFLKQLMYQLNCSKLALNKEQILDIQGRFQLKLQQQTLFLFQQVRIESEVIGNIKIVAFQGYQMIGKIKGRVQYEQSKFLNLSLIPVRLGRLVLPQIYINGRKGQWKNPIIIEVANA